MEDPIQILMAEHRVIETVLGALESAANRDVGVSFYERAVDFIATYADALHHGKEEDRLFPKMVERGMPAEQGPIAVMLEEHRIGRAHVAAMRAQIEAVDLEGLKRESLAYAALLRNHIAKEDQVLYPMGRNVLSAQDLEDLTSRFAEVVPPPGGAEAYVQLAADLAAEAGVGS